MTKQLVFVAALASALCVGTAYAQADAAKQDKPAKKMSQETGTAGHTAPKPQPDTAASPTAPTGEMSLGTVHFAKAVKANGETLAAGTYQVHLTGQDASTDNARGETPSLERWVEFRQGGKVKGKEVVTIVPKSEIDKVEKDKAPAAGASKVEMLKGGGYVRVWINKAGNHYLLHMPTA
jgi:hypothetical protein